MRRLLGLAMMLISSMGSPVLSLELAPADIGGKVIDKETGQPILGAVVKIGLEGKSLKGATTGQDGTFFLAQVPPGPKRIAVSLIGYESHDEEISLAPGSTLVLDIALLSDPIQLAPVEIIGESPLINQKRTGTASKLKPQTVELIKPVGTQELLELVPGINGYADDGFGNSRLSIGIRGLNPRRSSRVLIMEDGVPIQPAVYIYPNAYYNPPSERIDAMEVIKGSSAIRFGPQTMGGVINYATRRPDGTKGMVNQLTVGSNGYYSAFAELRGLGSRRITSDMQVLYKHGNGFRDNNAFDQVNGTAKTQFRLSSKKVLYLKANANFESSNATYTGLTEYSFYANPKFNPKEDDNFKVLRASLDLMYTSKITANLVGNTTAYLNVFDRRWWREDDVFRARFGSGDRRFYAGALLPGWRLSASRGRCQQFWHSADLLRGRHRPGLRAQTQPRRSFGKGRGRSPRPLGALYRRQENWRRSGRARRRVLYRHP